jgi:predicted ATPase
MNASATAVAPPIARPDANQFESFDYSLSISALLRTSEALVGRQTEIREISELIANDEIRLLTLTGTGGTGKTRLAKEIGNLLASNFPAGVVFVELEAVNDASMIGPAIAHALGFNETGTKTISELLSLKLHDRPMLLILDNFEQVISGGVHVAELLRAIPGIKILATSREPLKLSIEREYRVPPLALPTFGEVDDTPSLLKFESVQLFVERAKRARPDFELNSENASDVAAICKKLDGLPLAIELAAARARVLSAREILARLDDRLSLLTGGSRDLPDRQQTMRAAIEWSFDLLSDAERDVLAKLAVFEGGFSFKAAEAVMQGEAGMLDLITSLAEKNLLMSKQTSAGDIRFWMLQVVRDYSLEMLAQTGDETRLHRAHAEFFLGFVKKVSPKLLSIETARWLERLETEHDNIRAALRWSLRHDPAIAAGITAPMAELWTMHGHIREAEHWFHRVLESYHEKETAIRWELLTGLGIIKQFRGDLDAAAGLYREALEIARANKNDSHIAKSLRGIAAVEYIQSDFSAARMHTNEACEISHSIGDDFGKAASLARLGDIAFSEGDLENAALHTGRSLEIFRELGYVQGIAAKLSNLGAVKILQEKYGEAESTLRESLETSLEIGDITIARLVIDGFAALKTTQGELSVAARLSGFAAKLAGSLGIEGEPAEIRLRDFYIRKLRAGIGESKFAEAYLQGERMTLAEAAASALDSK